MSNHVQLTLFECTAKRARGDSGSSFAISMSTSACLGTASVTTQLATQLELASLSFQVCESWENNDASIMSNSVPSAWSITADSPVYSCPTLLLIAVQMKNQFCLWLNLAVIRNLIVASALS